MRPISISIQLAALFTVSLITCGSAQDTKSRFLSDTQQLPRGYVKIQVVNRSDSEITGIVAVGIREMTSGGKTLRSVRFFDSTLDIFEYHALKIAEAHAFTFFGPNPPMEMLRSRSVKVEAIVFGDGSRWGDPKWIDTIFKRRRLARDFDNEALKILLEGRLNGRSAERILERIRTAAEVDRQKATDIDGKQMAVVCFEEVEAMLEHSRTPTSDGITFAPSFSKQTAQSTDAAIQRLQVRIRALDNASAGIM